MEMQQNTCIPVEFDLLDEEICHLEIVWPGTKPHPNGNQRPKIPCPAEYRAKPIEQPLISRLSADNSRSFSAHQPSNQNMNYHSANDAEKEVFEVLPRVKTLHQDMNVADRYLKDKVLNAFNLAKSAGRELSVTFTAASIQSH
jgi:hypothetical protein